MKSRITIATGCFLGLISPYLSAEFPRLRMTLKVESQLQAPAAICNAGDGSGRLFIAEQRGQIRIFSGGMLLPTPFLNLSPLLVPERPGFDERGLLGLCFHPHYGQSDHPGAGRFYVAYSAPSPNAPGNASDPVDCRTRLVEYRVSAADPNLADPASARLLLSFDKPQFNHNGGDLSFGPDGLLYFSTGDGGSSNDNNAGHTGGSAARPTNALGNSQDLTNLLGKILRIDPLGSDGPGGAYGIPPSNPFVDSPGGARPEIYAYGLRNPWRICFDSGPGGTDRMFAADVGQNEVEEINLVVAGGNYGWRNKEGTFSPSFSAGAPPLTGNVVDPIAQYAHPGVTIGSPALPQIGISVTGGRFYRGAAIAGLAGKYVFGDWSQSFNAPAGTLLGLEEVAGDWTLSILDIEGGNPIPWYIHTFGTDEEGEIYLGVKKTQAVSGLFNGLAAGALFKLEAMPLPVTVALDALKDNTIYSNGELSNGQGEHILAGQTNQPAMRRALVKFDLSSVPANAQILDAKVSLVLNRTIAGDAAMSLHRLTSSWGEGNSNPTTNEGDGTSATDGDATWTKRFFDAIPANALAWNAPGGDYDATPSATTVVGSPPGDTRFFWSGAKLNADLTAALADPASWEGWILIGDEDLRPSAKRFHSREAAQPDHRPKLEIEYLPADPTPTHRQQWLARHYYVGEYVADLADGDGDTVPELFEYAFDQDPKSPDSPGRAFWIDSARGVHFLRDPRATDLTYTLRRSGTLPFEDPGTVLAISVAGAPPTGSVPISEAPAADNPELREVVVDLSDPDLANAFVRLEVIRN